ncbi:MAG: anaerobic sulfatase maturase, partial [Clostridium sp.]
ASGNCDMKCRYCFYRDELENRSIGDYGLMSYDTLEQVIRKSLSFGIYTCSLTFQGGEPTLVGIEFYQNVIRLVKKYNVNNCRIIYSIQTNGYSIDEEWAQFFHKYNFLVGISLDGYEETHDWNRIDKNGMGTFSRVMQSIELLKRYQVEFNILTVITDYVAANVEKIYDFYKKNGYVFQQYIECLEPLGEKDTGQTQRLHTENLAAFLKGLFDKWYKDMMMDQYVYIRYFENLIMLLAGQMPESCVLRGKCAKQWVIEADGGVYPCDFYVLDQWKLGNLNDDSMEKIESKREELRFIEESENVPETCTQCNVFSLCRNGCRRNCNYSTAMVNMRETNIFCGAYKEFLEYAYDGLTEVMKKYGVTIKCSPNCNSIMDLQ